jgi:hypothetical protein
MFILLGNYFCRDALAGDSCTNGMCGGGPNWGLPCNDDGNSDECGGAECQPYIN